MHIFLLSLYSLFHLSVFFKYLSLNTNESLDKSALQKSFEALNVHYSRNGKGLWHYHKYDTPDKSGRYTKMSGLHAER
ncbi:Protein of uncharacterised function (DUF1528) [Citrobacter koseri]|uniref:Protein of uncharacterized function (DUF1528) n=1 Tax=Citrobacter koseri TaxID=545 RepID=A0A447UQA1_CITKO|nr:Protein of uncharacterised function (DUF1528) [Citrobacter koseri]